jgi:hypothetical protein
MLMLKLRWGSPRFEGVSATALTIRILQGICVSVLDIGLSMIDMSAGYACAYTVAEVERLQKTRFCTSMHSLQVVFSYVVDSRDRYVSGSLVFGLRFLSAFEAWVASLKSPFPLGQSCFELANT